MQIKRPMKADSKKLDDEQLKTLNYPVFVSYKLDGIRAVIIDGVVLSSTLKPIKNEYIQECLGRSEYNGLDGELIVGNPNDPKVFNKTTGAVRRIKGEPDFKFYVFDSFKNKDLPYHIRLEHVEHVTMTEPLPFLMPVHQCLVNYEELLQFKNDAVDEGYEGAMVRSTHGTYKEGRCTLREQNVMKIKPMADTEGVIIGYGEALTNTNKAEVNEIGQTRRGSSKDGMVPADTLGYLVIKSDKWAEPFHLGAGAGQINDMKDEIWQNQDKYLGKVVKFTYQPYGSLDAPRLPIAVGFREDWDLTNY